MQWSLLGTLLHVVVAVIFMAGLIGRWILLTRAARAEDVETAFLLSDAAAPFERLVILFSQLILVTGLFAAWVRGYPWIGFGTPWIVAAIVLTLSVLPLVYFLLVPRSRIFEAAMADARQRGSWTPELRTAFRDPGVALARRWEFVSVGLVLALMVLKPSF
jgi:magnesium-transporting ATPase (P-type)